MVQTIFIDSLLMPALGLLLAVSIRPPPASQTAKPWFCDRWFYYRLVFGSVFGYGTAVVCYVLAPDWMWMYILDSKTVPWPLLVYVSVMYQVLLFAGALTAETMLPDRRRVFGGVCLLLAGTALICIVWFQRIWFIGSTAGYYRGEAIPLVQLSPFRVHMIVCLMFAAVVLGTIAFAGMYKAARQTQKY